MTFTPSGRDLPSVGIMAWASADVLQAIRPGPRAGNDARLFCRQISAQEFYAQILLPAVRQRAPGAARTAVAEVSGTVQRKARPSTS